MKNKIITVLCIVASLILLCSCGNKNNNKKIEPEITQMKSICELATMECYYHNVAKYTEENAEGFLFWTKDKKLWIEYTGIAKVGVDVSKVSIEVKGDSVTITLPQAKVLDTTVDASSLIEEHYYVDKDSAKITADDQTVAFTEAQKHMQKAAENNTTLLANAQQRVKDLLEDYVKNIGDLVGVEYKIKWIEINDEGTVLNESEFETIDSDEQSSQEISDEAEE